MDRGEIKSTVIRYIKQISEENDRILDKVEGHQTIVDDLGMTSLQIATLISFLETEFDIDPFSSNAVAITDIRTVDDLCEAYEKAFAQKS